MNNALKTIEEMLTTAIKQANDTGQILALSERLLQIYKAQDGQEDRLWKDEDVERFLGIKSANTLAKMRSARKLPYLKIPGLGIRYNPDSIRRWARNREIKMNPVWRQS